MAAPTITLDIEPDWDTGVEVVYAFNTVEQATPYLSEQRRPLIVVPSITVSCKFTEQSEKLQRLCNLLQAAKGEPLCVPVYSEPIFCSSIVTGGSSITALTDLSVLWNIQNCLYVVMIDYETGNSATFTIAHVTGQLIAFTTNIVGSWVASKTVLYPAFSAAVASNTKFSNPISTTGNIESEFEEIVLGTEATEEWVGLEQRRCPCIFSLPPLSASMLIHSSTGIAGIGTKEDNTIFAFRDHSLGSYTYDVYYEEFNGSEFDIPGTKVNSVAANAVPMYVDKTPGIINVVYQNTSGYVVLCRSSDYGVSFQEIAVADRKVGSTYFCERVACATDASGNTYVFSAYRKQSDSQFYLTCNVVTAGGSVSADQVLTNGLCYEAAYECCELDVLYCSDGKVHIAYYFGGSYVYYCSGVSGSWSSFVVASSMQMYSGPPKLFYDTNGIGIIHGDSNYWGGTDKMKHCYKVGAVWHADSIATDKDYVFPLVAYFNGTIYVAAVEDLGSHNYLPYYFKKEGSGAWEKTHSAPYEGIGYYTLGHMNMLYSSLYSQPMYCAKIGSERYMVPWNTEYM